MAKSNVKGVNPASAPSIKFTEMQRANPTQPRPPANDPFPGQDRASNTKGLAAKLPKK